MGKRFPRLCLYQPLIPQNTGNIARTCAGTGTPLHLVKPLGFSLEEKRLRRAGLDYWPHVELHLHDSLDEVAELFGWQNLVFMSRRGKTHLWDYRFPESSVLVLGAETTGLPQTILDSYQSQTVNIPINSCIRSLNLSTSAGIALYTAMWKTNALPVSPAVFAAVEEPNGSLPLRKDCT